MRGRQNTLLPLTPCVLHFPKALTLCPTGRSSDFPSGEPPSLQINFESGTLDYRVLGLQDEGYSCGYSSRFTRDSLLMSHRDGPTLLGGKYKKTRPRGPGKLMEYYKSLSTSAGKWCLRAV